MVGPGRGVSAPDGSSGRRATINDVATAAGVSRQTVTRAMNDMRGISGETKLRVLAAARELSYRPSRFGRGLVKPGPGTLGLLIDDLTNPFYPELASAILGRASQNGWNVVLADARHTPDQRTLIAQLTSQVDAVVGYLSLNPSVQPLLDGLPVVEIGPSDPRYGSVMLDLAPAMTQAVAHLVGSGVRRPVMIDLSASRVVGGRARLLVDAMAGHGVRTEVHFVTENTVAAGNRITDELIDRGRDFDAVLAFDDVLALGALLACRRREIDVPGAVRVLGIDGLTLGTYVTPQLSTLAIDFAEVARHAVDLAMGMSRGELPWSGPAVCRQVQHRLLLRESA